MKTSSGRSRGRIDETWEIARSGQRDALPPFPGRAALKRRSAIAVLGREAESKPIACGSRELSGSVARIGTSCRSSPRSSLTVFSFALISCCACTVCAPRVQRATGGLSEASNAAAAAAASLTKAEPWIVVGI